MNLADSMISPFGRTSRGPYWIAETILLCGGAAASLMKIDPVPIDLARVDPGAGPSLLIVVSVAIFHMIITVRRLHDAGFSRWWAALCLWPFGITVDLFEFQFGPSTWQFVNFSNALSSIPVLIGLIAKTEARETDSVAHIFR